MARVIIGVYILFLSIPFFTFGQSYIQVNQVAIQENNIEINNNLGLISIANSIDSFRNSIENENQRNAARDRALSQREIIQKQYTEKSSFPVIIDGWHLVKVTDNYNYCSDAKAFVKGGKLHKIVLNNYSVMSIDFDTMTEISDAKAVVNWQLPNGNVDIAEIYFAYDLEQPNLTSEPFEPGYITFWSDHRKAKTIEVWVNGVRQGQLSKTVENAGCFEKGALTLRLKPGTYKFQAECRGAMSWLGEFIIKEDKCLTYLLNRKNVD